MPRKLRVEYSGAIHPVMSRGERREDIFLDDVDRQDYVKTLAEVCHFGHVFSGRHKALLVDGSGTGHLETVCD